MQDEGRYAQLRIQLSLGAAEGGKASEHYTVVRSCTQGRHLVLCAPAKVGIAASSLYGRESVR
jgi:hypothetical protein